MLGLIDKLTKIIDGKLRKIGTERPSLSMLKVLLETAYHSTMMTEEGRLIRASITYMSPNIRPADGPATRRANYPSVWPLGRQIPFTVERLVKLARAIDIWSGSIMVYETKPGELHIWGIVDQLVEKNISLHQEGTGGFHHPGIVVITTEGAGNLTVYHQNILLCSLRCHHLLHQENDALGATMVLERISPYLRPSADAISRVLESVNAHNSQLDILLRAWTITVSRICIGLRRLGTGGSLLITPSPRLNHLELGYPFKYDRLGDAMILNELDEQYSHISVNNYLKSVKSDLVSYHLVSETRFSQTDAEDRQMELTGAVKVVTSLASADGLVLLSPILHVKGFGVKIGAGSKVGIVYDGSDFESRGTRAKKIELERFGTRHISILRYCRMDRNAVGVVISQDGQVRVILTAGRSLVMWDNVKLLDYSRFTAAQVKFVQDWAKNYTKTKHPSLGYTDTPKTLANLLHALDE